MFHDVVNNTGETTLRVNIGRIELLGQEHGIVKNEEGDDEEYTRYFLGVSGSLINIDEFSYNALLEITDVMVNER